MGQRIIAVAGALMLGVGGIAVAPTAQAASSYTLIEAPDSYVCNQSGFVDFEALPDGTALDQGSIAGVIFTTTAGYTWRVGDFITGNYNGKYPNGQYTSRGNHWAWLGPDQGAGRIDFAEGRVSVFSVLTSANTPVYLEAYDASGVLLESVGPAPANIGTGAMGELRIERSRRDIDHVLIHDSGNYFTLDAVCTDAKGVVTPSNYAALGDSFSAGEGNQGYEEGTDTALNKCHRSVVSYPKMLARDVPVLSDVDFVACSGAITDDLFNPNAVNTLEPAQMSVLSEETDVVTVTVGGNDAGFATVLEQCIFTNDILGQVKVVGREGCSDRAEVTGLVSDAVAALSGTQAGSTRDGRPIHSYADTLEEIHRLAPNARIYIATYPTIFGSFSRDPKATCLVGTAVGDALGWPVVPDLFVSWRDANWINLQVATLNAKLRTAVDSARGAGMPVTLVNTGKSFSQHGLCDRKQAWFHSLVFSVSDLSTVMPDSFHPNAAGQKAFADSFRKAGVAG